MSQTTLLEDLEQSIIQLINTEPYIETTAEVSTLQKKDSIYLDQIYGTLSTHLQKHKNYLVQSSLTQIESDLLELSQNWRISKIRT